MLSLNKYMDIDIEIACLLDGVDVEHLKATLEDACQFEKREKSSRYIFLRTNKSKTTSKPVGQALSEFLVPFTVHQKIFSTIEGRIRIGLFFDTGKVAFPSASFSKSDLAILNVLGLALEISCYPCSPKNDPTSPGK